MIDNQIDNINAYTSENPQNTEYVAKFFAEIMKCLAMMTITSCLTLANYALYGLPLPVSMPHCIISNLMYMYVVFKMRLINMDQINVMEKMGYNQDNQNQNAPPGIELNQLQEQGQEPPMPQEVRQVPNPSTQTILQGRPANP